MCHVCHIKSPLPGGLSFREVIQVWLVMGLAWPKAGTKKFGKWIMKNGTVGRACA